MAGKNKIMQAVVSFAGTIDPSLGKAMDNVAGHLDKVNWKAVAVGAAVGGIAVATGKAVVEAGKYLAELGDDYNKAMNQLSASTGATGDEFAQYVLDTIQRPDLEKVWQGYVDEAIAKAKN